MENLYETLGIYFESTCPAAQFPEAAPPLLLHSDDVKQVPFRNVLQFKINQYNIFTTKSNINPTNLPRELWLLHPLFLKETTEKSEKTVEEKLMKIQS